MNAEHMGKRLLVFVTVTTLVFLTACGVRPGPADRGATASTAAPAALGAAGPIPRPVFWLEAPIAGDPSPMKAQVPADGAVLGSGTVRLLRPSTAPRPRRVAIQAGHWKAAEAPAEFPNLATQFGASFGGVDEVDVNLDIAQRVALLLRQRGLAVDVLPATIPPGYLADAFVALHADSDGYGDLSGFKIAHGFYRGAYEDELVGALTTEYAAQTGLPWDDHISDDMTDYYAFAWFRYEHALSPYTPAAIVEMGFLSNDNDRQVLLDDPSVAAQGIADGVVRFLAAEPQSALYSRDIVVPTVAPPP